ncbi:hypothetical protein CRUP_016652 [Coryphaenoides rupestris]|nr:hypothetical protein CRUP_016652 [Coryphaenoides rupestris]
MKDRGNVVLPWALQVLLLGTVVLLLLGSAGLLCLLLRHRELTQHVARLDAELHAVSRTCGTLLEAAEAGEAGETGHEAVEGGPAPGPGLLRGSRMRRGAKDPGGEGNQDDMLMMMTYSRVPVCLGKTVGKDLRACPDWKADEEKEVYVVKREIRDLKETLGHQVLLVQGVQKFWKAARAMLGPNRSDTTQPWELVPVKPMGL